MKNEEIVLILIGIFFASLLVLYLSNKLSIATSKKNYKGNTFTSIVTGAFALTGVVGGYFLFEKGFEDAKNSSIYFSAGSLIITFFLSFFIQILSSLDQMNREENKEVAKDKKIIEYETEIKVLKREIESLKSNLDITVKVDLDKYDAIQNASQFTQVANKGKEKSLIVIALLLGISFERLFNKK